MRKWAKTPTGIKANRKIGDESGGLGLKSGQWSEVKLRELTDTLFLFYLLGTLFVLTGRMAVVSRRNPSSWWRLGKSRNAHGDAHSPTSDLLFFVVMGYIFIKSILHNWKVRKWAKTPKGIKAKEAAAQKDSDKSCRKIVVPTTHVDKQNSNLHQGKWSLKHLSQIITTATTRSRPLKNWPHTSGPPSAWTCSIVDMGLILPLKPCFSSKISQPANQFSICPHSRNKYEKKKNHFGKSRFLPLKMLIFRCTSLLSVSDICILLLLWLFIFLSILPII